MKGQTAGYIVFHKTDPMGMGRGEEGVLYRMARDTSRARTMTPTLFQTRQDAYRVIDATLQYAGANGYPWGERSDYTVARVTSVPA